MQSSSSNVFNALIGFISNACDFADSAFCPVHFHSLADEKLGLLTKKVIHRFFLNLEEK